MTESYEEVWLGPETHSVLEEWLRGGRSLCQRIPDYFKVGTGTASTILPKGKAPPTAKGLTWSFQAVAPDAPTRWAISRVQRFLGSSQDSVVVFENECARPSDPWVKRRGLRTLFFEDEVYHLLTSKDARAPDLIRKVMCQADTSGYRFVGVMTSSRGKLGGDSTRLTAQALDDLASRCQHIIFGAFDKQGYIIWSHGD